jgi:hypothetical protein
MKPFKSKSVTGIMSQFQTTVDQLEALAASKGNESQHLADLVVKVEDIGDRFQLWVYNLHRKVVSMIDDFQMNLADKYHFKALDAQAEAQAASVLAEKIRAQFNLK